MDRFSWGFYAWRVGAAGRWEWHFCWPEDQAKGGYPGREWYNPFTGQPRPGPVRAGELPRRHAVQLGVPRRGARASRTMPICTTLERLIEERAKSEKHAKTVKEARRFLRR